jgi:hypothetical protein
MVRRAPIAGRVMERKLAQLVPIAAHADLTRAGGHDAVPGLGVDASCVSRQVVRVADRVLAEDVQAVRDVRGLPCLVRPGAILHDGFTEDVLESRVSLVVDASGCLTGTYDTVKAVEAVDNINALGGIPGESLSRREPVLLDELVRQGDSADEGVKLRAIPHQIVNVPVIVDNWCWEVLP